MKTQKLAFLLIVLLLFMPLSLLRGQGNQMFWVHEDVVKPSMVGEYEGVIKELTDNMKKFNIPEIKFIVSNLADSRYLYVSPLANMAALDKPVFATLAEKMGSDAMTDLFNRMDKCYDTEQDYVITLDNELSYQPGGIDQTPKGQDYRKFHYLHVAPGDRAMIRAKMKAVKDLFESKGSKMYYRVYSSGFGTRGDFYMVAIAAKDAVDYAQKGTENDALIGEEGGKVMGDLFGHLLKYEEVTGRMRPDLAYAPQ